MATSYGIPVRPSVLDRLRATPLVAQTGVLSLGLALAWMLVGPRTADLAAQTYRVWLFAQDGPLLWDNSWYGGHHLLGYSLVFPPLGALLGTRLAGLLAAVAATALFAELARRHFGPRAARAGALWFAAGTGADLAIGRLTYLTGVAFGLAALVAVQRRRPVLAGVAAVLCAVTSPIAGAFLALVAVVPVLTRRSRRALALSACALVPALALTALFPEGGRQPFFLGSALAGVVLVVLLARALPRAHVDLRVGAALYAATILAAWLVPSPMGGNAVRLGAGFAGALLLCARTGRLGRGGIALLLALAVWQWAGPVVEILKTSDNPATKAAYFAPLMHELGRRGAGRGRVEVVPTATRWEAVYVARRFALARGWETQLDRRYNPLFATARLSPERYARWLRRNAVHYVALPDVSPERFGRTEASVVARPEPFLRPVWRGRHWQLYAVRGAQPLVDGPGEIRAILSDGFTLVARRPGRLLVRVHSSPWWTVTSGRACLTPGRSGWTTVRALRPGRIEVRALLTRPGPACPGAA